MVGLVAEKHLLTQLIKYRPGVHGQRYDHTSRVDGTLSIDQLEHVGVVVIDAQALPHIHTVERLVVPVDVRLLRAYHRAADPIHGQVE